MNLDLLFRNYKTIIILAGILLIGLISLFIYRGSSNKPEAGYGALKFPQISSVISNEVKVNTKLELNKKPKSINLWYVYQKSEKLTEREIAQKLGFKGEPQKIGEQLLWREGTHSLRFKYPSSDLSYVGTTKIQGGDLSSEAAIALAKDKLKELELISDTNDLQVRRIKRLDFDIEAEEIPEGEPFNIYSLTFGVQLDSLPVINRAGSQELIDVWVGKDGTIQKINGESQTLNSQSKSSYRIKPFKEVESEIKESKAIVINTTSRIVSGIEMTITYTEAEFAYLIHDISTKYFEPVYLLKGNTFMPFVGSGEVTAIISALDN